jgi:hypothetical protein
MDFDFLVFPKPEFKSAGDTFYSRLLLVPRRAALSTNIVMKKPSLSVHRVKTDGHADAIHPDMEGCARIPRASHFKGLGIMKDKEKGLCNSQNQEHGITVVNSSIRDLVDPESPVKQQIRSVKPVFLKLPRKIEAGHEPKAEDLATCLEFSPSKEPIDVRHLNPNTSRFFSRDHHEDEITSTATMNKLVNTLSKYQGSNFKLIAQIPRPFSANKFYKPKHFTSSAKKKEEVISLIDEDFVAPYERSPEERRSHNIELHLGHPEKTKVTSESQTEGVTLAKSLQKRSLQQLNHKFSIGIQPDLKLPPPITTGFRSPGARLSSTKLNSAKPITKSSNISFNFVDGMDELAKMQSPDSRMAQYNQGSEGLKLGQLFLKRKVPVNGRPCFIKDQLGAATQLNIAIQPKLSVASEAAKNRNLIQSKLNEIDSIPCLLIAPDHPTDMVMVYFHANGEDILQAQHLCEFLKSSFNVASREVVLGDRDRVSRV